MRRPRQNFAALLALALICAAAPSCKREQRSFRVPPPAAEASQNVAYLDTIRPGPSSPGTPSTSRPVNLGAASAEPYSQLFQDNAQALSDGATLYLSFNCVGCHAHGGGGMGPPLLDNKWVYGNEPANVYTSIMEGRPNGMPSFRGRIPDSQIWSLVAFVRSKSGQVNQNAAPGRRDHMKAEPPPNSMPKGQPQTAPAPPDQTAK